MADVEKVISALECVIQYGPHYCGGEFGDENEYSRIGQNVLMDALALLKAQEPRVLMVEEVVLLKQNDVVWLEDYNKKDVIPAIVSRMGPMVICIEFALSDRFISVGYDDYGKRWRCWTSRPTDEQREATPWE